MSDVLTLPALVRKLEAAVARAIETSKGDDEQKAYLRITQKLREHEPFLADARFLLTSPNLPVDADERATLLQAVTVLRHATARARQAMQTDPRELRQGPLWKSLDQAATTLRTRIEEVRTSASRRLVELHVVPSSNVATLLVAGDPLRIKFRSASDHYEQLPKRFGSDEEIARFVHTVGALRDIAEQIEERAAPPEHRAQWAKLVRGGLTLATLDSAFTEWLTETGRAEQVALRLTDT